MTRTPLSLALTWLLLAAGCSTVNTVFERPASRLDMAREALHRGAFTTADQILSALAAEEPDTAEGDEALFLLGLLHLDPRNPAWSPAEAEVVLARYLEFPFGEHRPEGVALYALARRLAKPQIAATTARTVPLPADELEPPQPGAELEAIDAGEASEADRLRAEVAARDRELAKLRDEIERIRRRLTPSPPG
ncbi:MAG TPA: hypothetical protein VF100_07840 [Thermoanaerobaculia bacterium]